MYMWDLVMVRTCVVAEGVVVPTGPPTTWCVLWDHVQG